MILAKLPTVEGWKDIAVFVSERSGMDLSPDAARKLSYRVRDPLPVKRWGRRVSANLEALRAWVDRQMR
jgi:hypothetical protein